MKVHKMRSHWRVCLGGLGWGLLALWIPLAFPLEYFPRSSPVSFDLFRLFLPEGLAGFLLIVLLDRYISRVHEKKVRWIAGAVLCLFSLGMPLAGMSWPVLHGGLFVSCAACGLLIYPVMKDIENPRQALTVFFWTLVTCAAGLALGSAVVKVFESFVWLRMVSAAILAVGGLWLLTKRADCPPGRKENRPAAGTALAKPLLPAVISFLCLAAVFLQIAYAMRSAVFWEPLSLTAMPLLLAGIVYMGRALMLTGGLWRLAYVAFGCFALGILCAQLSLPGAYAAYLPLFFYVAAAGALAGLCVYFICMGVSVYNRALILGLFFVVCTWFVQAILHADLLPLLRAHVISPVFASVSAAFVFVAGPLLFGPFAHREEPVRPGAPDSGSMPEPVEKPVDADGPPLYVTQFTGAEIKVYELILRGYTNQQIADALFISINTVKFHVKNILSKAGVNKRYKLYNAGQTLSDT